MNPMKIFVGWDPREAAAYHTFTQSIIERASGPVSITPLVQSALRANGLYWRPPDEKAATQFSLTRFLIPALCNYEGVAIFADCDMLALGDIYHVLTDVAGATDPRARVSVCKHDYIPKHAVKMDGVANATYPRKNWSSFMVFDCAKCTMLTPEYVNTATPAQLHRFEWAGDAPWAVGSLPLYWNWLVGEYPPNPAAKILHFTEGGPWFPQTADCDHANEWLAEWYRIELPVRLALQSRTLAA